MLGSSAFILGALSGLIVSLLGLTALLRPRASVPGGRAFGIFAVLWGIEIVLAHLGAHATTGPTGLFYLAAVSILLVLPLFLLSFTRRVAQGDLPDTVWYAVVSVVVGTAATALVVLFAWPDLIYEGARAAHGQHIPSWGPLMPVFVNLPHFAVFAFAVWALERARRHATTPRIAARLLYLVAGLTLYLGNSAASNLVVFASIAQGGSGLSATLHALLFFVLTVVLLTIGTTIWHDGQGRVDPQEARRSRWLVVAFSAPIALGLVEGALAATIAPTLNLVGVWRILGVAFLAFGVETWRRDGLTTRATQTLRTGTPAVGAAAGGGLAYGLGTLVSTGLVFPAAAALLGAALVFAPLRRLTRRRTAPSPTDDRRYDERIETYRAALEMALARRSMDRDAGFLAALRERLRISDDEHRLLHHLARKTVIPIRRGDSGAAYERLRLLGEGGNGRTWLARDRRRDALVVLKEPLERWQTDPTVVDAVVREARLAAKVRHRHVVRIHEVVDDGPLPIIVMDYLPGGTLSDLLRQEGALPWPRARDVLLGVLHGLAAVHAAGIVHRDIKPSNVLFDEDDEPHLADFGIAIQSGTGGTVLIHQGPVGSRGYIAPEVARGETPGDERADIFACGVLLHHCVHGAPLDHGAVHYLDPDLPPQIDRILRRATEPDPTRRYADVASFADDLHRIAT